MSKKSIVVRLTLAALLMLAFGVGSFQASNLSAPNPLIAAVPQAQPSCDELVKNAMANARKAFTVKQLKQFKTARFRFGFTCNAGDIKILGTLPGKANREKVINAVTKTNGVKTVDHSLFKQVGGCKEGTFDCKGDGSVCAPDANSCPPIDSFDSNED